MRFDPSQQLAGAFLARADGLESLAGRAVDLIAMRRLYREHMPAGLSQASVLLNFRNGIVVVSADHSAAAAKIKQLTTRLTALFLEKGWQVSAIQVQVQELKGR